MRTLQRELEWEVDRGHGTAVVPVGLLETHPLVDDNDVDVDE